jgi:hypothetical protein
MQTLHHEKINGSYVKKAEENACQPQPASVSARAGKIFFLSGNLGQRLEIFCEICNVTITKLQK